MCKKSKHNPDDRPRSVTQINAYIQTEYPDIIVVRGDGYFYLTSDDDDTLDRLSALYSTSIGVYSASHQTFETWLNDVKRVLSDWHRSDGDQMCVYHQ